MSPLCKQINDMVYCIIDHHWSPEKNSYHIIFRYILVKGSKNIRQCKCSEVLFEYILTIIQHWLGVISGPLQTLGLLFGHMSALPLTSQLALRRWPNVGPTSTLGQRRLTNVGPTWICQLAQRWPNGCTPTLAQRCANIGPTLAH